MAMDEPSTCGLCGLPMPDGEEMFNYHGYSGPCPGPVKAPDPRATDEIGWVIEEGEPNRPTPLYWAGSGWSYINTDAVRFARRVDAERVAATLNEKTHVAEHMWMAPRSEGK